MISAQIIADSISPDGIRLTTFKLRYPKFIHGEFMTHRVFSRNASSSRAIPTSKILEEVRNFDTMAHPEEWGKNQKGMSASENLSLAEQEEAMAMWHIAAKSAADHAEEMLSLGIHKQIVNRILEPFTHINVVVTATEWDNFFGLRLDPGAQPEIRILATMMFVEMYDNIHTPPKEVGYGYWHLPFVTDEEKSRTVAQMPDEFDLVRISVARCARVSYLSFETGKQSTIEEDLKLYDRLMGAQPVHASPAEHQATPVPPSGDKSLCGNFRGWNQFRKTVPGEACAPLPKEYEWLKKPQ